MKIKPGLLGKRSVYHKKSGNRILTKDDFIKEIRNAVMNPSGYAAARIGISEQFWMYYPVILHEEKNRTRLRVFEKHLRYHAYLQSGIFPAEHEFLLEYNDFFLEHIKSIDCLGMIMDSLMGPEIICFHKIRNNLIFFKDMIPDRSIPCNPDHDYLHYFRGKKILLVCPFAHFLKKRAARESFEKVWAKIEKKWFYPKSVDSIEFPYGFSKEAHAEYASSIELFHSVEKRIKKKDFDIALIAAGGITVPIAASVKNMGKTAVSLGGDLQVLFGVKGRRWRGKERWRRYYFNEWWAELPERYHPDESNACNGAYW